MLKYNNNNMYNKMNNIYRYKKKEPHERNKNNGKEKVNRMEPSHPARQQSPQVATTAEGRTVTMVLEIYIHIYINAHIYMYTTSKRKSLRERIRHPPEKPSGIHGLSNKPVQHTFRKSRRKRTTERDA